MIVPTVGRIVHYTLDEHDANHIRANRQDYVTFGSGLRRGSASGNHANAGNVFPMLITRTWGDEHESAVNGTVFLDGPDTLWVTSVQQGDGERHWHVPPRV